MNKANLRISILLFAIGVSCIVYALKSKNERKENVGYVEAVK